MEVGGVHNSHTYCNQYNTIRQICEKIPDIREKSFKFKHACMFTTSKVISSNQVLQNKNKSK